MDFQHLSWILVALSLAGNYFVNKKNVTGQWLWAASNVGWVSYNLYIESYSQAFLFTIYFGMCMWGIISWTRSAKNEVAIEGA
jgi:hypothetical protein